MTAPRDQDTDTVAVWDVPVRVFHWILLGLVATLAITGYLVPPWGLGLHAAAGYGLVVLLVFRLIWGVIGGRHSRFTAFPLAPKRLITHLRGLLKGRSPRYTGHTPAGAWMIVLLVATLMGLAITGLVTLGGQENQGPLAAVLSYATGHAAAEVHEALAAVLLTAIAGHIAGIVLETRVFGHPLVRAMITGRKPVPAAETKPARALAGRGIAVVGVVATLLIAAGWGLSSLPSGRWHAVSAAATAAGYDKACGDCHHAHHPSLRTASGWRAVMAGLSDHYGEDASLTATEAEAIRDYLTGNAAETFDTKAANRIGRASPEAGRITETRFWKRRHRDLDSAVFKRRDVGSAVNCNACHKDAATGRFNGQAIHVPEGAPS